MVGGLSFLSEFERVTVMLARLRIAAGPAGPFAAFLLEY